MDVLTAAELAALEQSCDKHEIRGADRAFVIDYAKLTIWQMTMLRSVFSGHAEIVGLDTEGFPDFALTPKAQAALRAQGPPKETP